MKPLVSTLMPAYNAEHWITDTIQSAMAQTWPRKRSSSLTTVRAIVLPHSHDASNLQILE